MNIEELGKGLSQSAVKTRDQNGFKLSYIEGHHAIREANRIFGYDGWIRETLDVNEVQNEQVDGKWRVSYTARSQVTVGPVVRQGVGFGQGIDKDLGRAHESAIKEAETDAMKRALMTFGDPFGLALYDKEQAHVEKPGVTPKSTGPGQDTIKRIVGEMNITKDQFAAFQKLPALNGRSWSTVLLEAHEEGCNNYDRLIEFVGSKEKISA